MADMFGAGRSLSYSWPRFDYTAALNTQPDLGIVWRPTGIQENAMLANGVGGVPPNPQGRMTYRGLDCYKITGGPTSVRVFQPVTTAGLPLQMFFPIERPELADIGGLDPLACWRIAGLLAFDNPTGDVSGDLGITVCPGLNTTPKFGETGVTFGVSGPQTVSVVAVAAAGGPRTYDAPVEGPSDITRWNEYAIHLVGARLGYEAAMKFYINRALVLQLDYGPGTLLPGLSSGVNLGLRWSLSNRGAATNTGMYVALGGMEIAAAATEEALL